MRLIRLLRARSSDPIDTRDGMQNRRGFPHLTGLVASGFLALALALLPASLEAQRTTSGEIRGQVVTEDGRALAEAAVVAENQETGFRRTTLTSGSGVYVLRLLPPGTYRVEVQQLGFASQAVTDVQVTVGGSTVVRFEMGERAVELEGVEVVGERRGMDVGQGSVAQLVNRQEIDELPALGRDFTDFINLSGLVSPDPGETTGGQFAIAGQRASQTNLQIDGVDANNSFFGENRGGSRIPFVFSLESIEEFQIITNGFDVEHGNYSGGIVNVITRGGTNEFQGSVYGNFQSDALTGTGFRGEDPADFEVIQFAAQASGPIIEDQLFYFFSLDGQRRREPQLPITLTRFSPEGTNPNPQAFQEMQRFVDIIGTEYGVENPAEGYAPFETTNDVLTLFGRLDWTINEDHRLSVRHNYADFENDNEFSPFFDSPFGRSRAERLQDVSHSFVTELQSVLGPNTFNVFRFQYADEDRPRLGHELRPEIALNLSNGQRIGYGGTFASFNNILEESKVQVVNNLTHQLGEHTLKLGGNFITTEIFNQFILEGAGAYSFSSLDDLENFRPSSFRRNIQEGGGIPRSTFDVVEWSLYAQDEWQVTPRLTATLGLRYDVQDFTSDPGRVIDVERAFGVPTGIAPEDTDNISPRAALVYDIDGDGTRLARAGVGYFYGRVPYVLGGNVEQTVRPVLELNCTGSIEDGDPDAPPPPVGYAGWGTRGFDNPESCAGGGGVGGVPTYTLWNDDFEFPETLKASLGYEQLLGESTRASLDLLFSESTKLYTVRNLNLRDPQFALEGEGGRRIFQPASVFDPSASDPTANSLRSRRNLEFGDVFMNFNDGRARAINATLEVDHRLNENTSLRGSYTFTRAWDNSSYSCCTASSGFSNPTVGAFGPNDVGGIGDEEKAWGRSDFARDHTFILSGFTELPYGIDLAAFWRLQSGRPWGPEVSGDLNGDGVRFNDRPFIFAPEDLPLAATGAEAEEQRERYASFLAEEDCIGDHVGGIVERNTCRFPWFNRLDMRLSRDFEVVRGQRAEFQLDLFNVFNGIGSLFCDSDDPNEDLSSGPCSWGQFVGVFGSDRNLLQVQGFDEDEQRILYSVPNTFAQEGVIGANLLMQFQARVAFRYYF